MNCNHRCYECHIPACPDRIRQSIGPRIIPMFADPPEWSADKVYSPLTLVIHDGATFMSRRCVPANTPLPTENPFYNESWVMVYDMNAQVAQYREEVAQLSQQVTDFSGKVDSWEQMIVEWTALISNWSSQFPEFTKDLAAITERVATLETKMDQAQQNITALQTTQQTHTEQIAANTQAIADLTPRVQAAEEHLTELDAEQQNQDERLNNIDEGQNLQNTQIKALQDADTEIKQNVSANTTQIAENAEAIAANAAEIAKHAERLEALETSQGEQDTKIQANADAIAQHTIDIGQAKAAAQQAQDTANHADSVAQAAQKLAQQAKDAADAAAGDLSGVTDRVQALETSQGTQDGKISALETAQTEQGGQIDALETAQTQTSQEIAGLKDGSVELPYVKKVNGSATGTLAVENLTVSGTATVKTPVNGTDAANKTYVDQAVQDATGGITPDVTQLKTDVEALQQSQSAQDGKITALEGSQSTQDGKITALENAQSEQEGRLDNLENGTTALPYLKKTGDTGTGTFNFTGAALQIAEPTQNNNPASKQYVDQAVENATDPELTAKVEELENTVNGITDGTTTLPYLSKNGDSSSGNYNFTGNVTVPVPSQAAQAVNKQYADSAISTAITELKSEIGGAGPTGHMEFVDCVFLTPGASKTFNNTSPDDKYIFITASTAQSAGTPERNVSTLWYNGDANDDILGFTVNANSSSITFRAFQDPGIVTAYKFIADGDQPQPDPTTFFTELNPPVILSATSANPQTVEGDLTATLKAMIATQSNWFKYKMQDGSGKTYYVMSASEIQPTDSSATNVLYCTEAGTWYRGETMTFDISKLFTKVPDTLTMDNGTNQLLLYEGNELEGMLLAMQTRIPNGYYYYIATTKNKSDYRYVASPLPIEKNHTYNYDDIGLDCVRQNGKAPQYDAMLGSIFLTGIWNE